MGFSGVEAVEDEELGNADVEDKPEREVHVVLLVLLVVELVIEV